MSCTFDAMTRAVDTAMTTALNQKMPDQPTSAMAVEEIVGPRPSPTPAAVPNSANDRAAAAPSKVMANSAPEQAKMIAAPTPASARPMSSSSNDGATALRTAAPANSAPPRTRPRRRPR